MTRFFRASLLWMLMCLFALWIYWPGLAGPAVLDDTQNLMVLNILDEHPEYAVDQIFDNESGALGRSVSMATFVAERLWFYEGSFGVKRTNLMLHLICATLIFLLLNQWLRVTGWRFSGELALLGASIWLLTPLFVSTALYQVQRMAQLSTFFSLALLLVYGVWRNRFLQHTHHFSLVVIMVCLFFLGVFSKENAVLIVPLILVVEFFWYSSEVSDSQRYSTLKRLHKLVFYALFMSLIALLLISPGYFLSGYTHRDFSLLERLMTQTRVLWHYIAQFFWADVHVLGVYHDDFDVSRSFSSPVSTLFSVFSWLLVLAGIVSAIRWPRLRKLVFGVVFFLVAHTIESGVIGLELYFEHRNYLPALGLVVCFLVFLGFVIQSMSEVVRPLFSLCALYLVFVIFKTSSQVQVWSHPDLFYMASISGHPESLRANVEYANNLARKGFLLQALEYSRRADALRKDTGVGGKALREMAIYCLANAKYPYEKMDGFTFDFSELASGRFNMALQFILQKVSEGRCDAFPAEHFANRLAMSLTGLKSGPGSNNNALLLAAQLDSGLGNYERALQYTQRVLVANPEYVKALLMHLHFATAVQDHEQIALAKERLFALKAENKLDKHALYTLSLYTQGNEADTKTDTP